MFYTIRRICEDDYGCEERAETEEDMVMAQLEDGAGERRWVRLRDEALRRADLDEGSRLTGEELETLQ